MPESQVCHIPLLKQVNLAKFSANVMNLFAWPMSAALKSHAALKIRWVGFEGTADVLEYWSVRTKPSTSRLTFQGK